MEGERGWQGGTGQLSKELDAIQFCGQRVFREGAGGRRWKSPVRATVRLLYVLALLNDISLGEEVVRLYKTYVEWGVIEEF